MLDVAPLYEQYAPRISAWFGKKLPRHDPGLADEMTATVFEKALRAAPRHTETLDQPSAWLFRIASTTLTDWFQKRRPDVGLPDLDLHRGTVDAGSDAHLTQLAMRQWLPALRAPYRVVLEARFIRDESLQEIASRERVTTQVISQRQHYALTALRKVVLGEVSTAPWQCQECGADDRSSKKSAALCHRCYGRMWARLKRAKGRGGNLLSGHTPAGVARCD